MEINVLGGSGFIGSRYCELTSNVLVNSRDDLVTRGDEVVYFISTIDNYNVFTDPYLDINTNLVTLITTLESLKGTDRVFNFISSWFVYGDVPLPAKESYICDPKGFYSITKHTAEQLIISYCDTFNIKYRILRLGNVLGKTDTKVSKKKNALQYMLNELKLNNPISLYDGGQSYRDYIRVDDVVYVINLILNHGKTNDIYNIGNGIPVYLNSVIQYAKDKLQSTSEILSIDTVEFHKKVQTKNMVLDISKIQSLGYTPEACIYNIIDDLIK